MRRVEIRNYLFHRVSDENKAWAPAMSPKKFEKCLQYICKRNVVKNIEDLFLHGELEQSNSHRIACITFDDGFKDNIEVAEPLLRKYGIKASFYVTTDCIDEGLPTWTHIVPYLFESTRSRHFSLRSALLPKEYSNQNFSSRQEMVNFGRALFKLFFRMPYEETQNIISQVKDQFADAELPGGYMMSWDNVRELNKLGYKIGSHTSSHPILTNIQERDSLLGELVNSKNRIESECRIPANTISYPIGMYNNEIKTIAKECGYKIGLSVNQKFCYSNDIDHFDIPRVDVYANDGWLKTCLRLSGYIERMRNIIK